MNVFGFPTRPDAAGDRPDAPASAETLLHCLDYLQMETSRAGFALAAALVGAAAEAVRDIADDQPSDDNVIAFTPGKTTC